MTKAKTKLTTTPEEALELYFRERSIDGTDSTLEAHEYRLNHFVRWCEEVQGIEDTTELDGRDLHSYKLWRKEDGGLNKVSLKSQMDTLRVFLRFCASIDAVVPDLHEKVMSPTLSDGVGQRDVKIDAEAAGTPRLPRTVRVRLVRPRSHASAVADWRADRIGTGARLGGLPASY